MAEKDLQAQLDTLKSAVKNLLAKVEENTTSLWKPDISETEECVVLFPCAFKEDPDDSDSVVEFDGVEEALKELEKLV